VAACEDSRTRRGPTNRVRATLARAWQQLGGAALNELWDNPEDAVYDAWREIYRSHIPTVFVDKPSGLVYSHKRT